MLSIVSIMTKALLQIFDLVHLDLINFVTHLRPNPFVVLLPYLSIIPRCNAIYTPMPDDAKRLSPPVSLALSSCDDTRDESGSRHGENAPDHHESHKCRHDKHQRCVVIVLHYSLLIALLHCYLI